MYLLKGFINRNSYFTIIIRLVGLIWLSNITACNCNKGGAGAGGRSSGSLLMSVSNTDLVGPAKIVEINLDLSDNTKAASLKDFTLHISFSEEESGTGSQIKYDIYKDGKTISKTASSVEEQLIHLTTCEKLEPGDESIKLLFTLIPNEPSVTKLVTTVQLLDAQGVSSQDATVTWEAEAQPIDLALERTTSEHIQGKDNHVKLKITNQGKQKIKTGEAKLKITRTAGDHATILQALPTTTPNVYELTLVEIGPGDSIEKNLTIVPEADSNATFEFELIPSKSHPDKPISVSWKQGIVLTLDQIKYNIKTKQISYSIHTGSVIPNNLKLEYTSKTPGIKLNGIELVPDKKGLKDLTDLHIAPESSLQNQILGTLDFNANKSANFEFRLVYEGMDPTIQPQPHTFNTEAIDLHINKLAYDPITGIVTYNIINKGASKAEGISLQYSNISDEKENPDERTVLLEGVSTARISLGDIAENNGEIGDRQLVIDFKYANKATFEFNLLYNGTPITQATKVETFEARPVMLKLVPMTPLSLIGANQEIRFKVEHDPQGRPLTNIDLSKLKLVIPDELENGICIWHTNKGGNIQELTLNELALISDIGNEITLYLDMGSFKETQFRLALTYKGLPIIHASPLHISWKEATLAIQELGDLTNNNIATFKLKNLNTAEFIDPKSITIQLLSDNTAEFTLLKSDKSRIGDSAGLNQLIGDNLLHPNTPTNPIQFRLANETEEDKATITIIVKRGSVELDKQTVRWEKQPISMHLITPRKSFTDQEAIYFSIENDGPSTSIDKTRIYIKNNQGVNFKLTGIKDIIGDNIDISLKDILGSDKLEKDQVVDFSLELADDLTHLDNIRYTVQLVLEIRDDNRPLDIGKLVWINNEDLESTKENLTKEIEAYKKNFLISKENIERQIRDKNDDPLDFYQNIDQLITNQFIGRFIQKEIKKDILQNIESQCKELNKQDYPTFISKLESYYKNVLPKLEKRDQKINKLIIKSLNHAKRQIEEFAKESETTSSQNVTSASSNTDKIEGWLNILTIVSDADIVWEASDIVLEAKEIASNIIKELEENKQTTTKVSDITKTPERRAKKQQKFQKQAKRKTPRTLFGTDNDGGKSIPIILPGTSGLHTKSFFNNKFGYFPSTKFRHNYQNIFNLKKN